ncbi:protoporphyrinogen oxidase [Hesseltinella vesiculosa]|uniref:Protoporphyrinogen oxidase n=1 Tax=Hesseltinella vesiculosa TaxID=101127 RepID=A0A1X2G4V7_9FUNG|nr:protoporphyrinogen oxidase [Hesseltinella vesiculosa]
MPRSIVVLGGGISGLSAAYYLSRLVPQAHIRLIESNKRAGGFIKTQQVNDHLIFEAGPRTLRPHGTSGTVLLDMIKDLDLSPLLVNIPKSHPSAQHRYIEYHGQINQLPSGLADMLLHSPPIMDSVITAGMREPFLARASTTKDESLYNFMERRFNEHTALNLMGAMAHGIYAGDAKQLSVHSTFPILAACEQEYGSVVLGMLSGKLSVESPRERQLADACRAKDPEWFKQMQQSSVLGFLPGLGALPSRLTQFLSSQPNVSMQLGETVSRLDGQSSHQIEITTSQGQIYHADHIVSTLPSHALARISMPTTTSLPHLTHNPSADVALVNLAYEKCKVKPGLDGFGFLTPHADTMPPSQFPGLLGMIFDSNSLGVQDQDSNMVRFTAMIGGADWNLAFGSLHDNDAISSKALTMATAALSKYLEIHESPAHYHCRILRQCIPQYLVGHRQRMNELHAALQHSFGHTMSVTGASYLGVSVPDCIKHSRMLIEDLVDTGALGSKQAVITGLEKVTLPMYYKL